MRIVQEHVLLTNDQPFLIRVFDNPDLSYPFHQHEKCFELAITIGLSGTRMVGDSTMQFNNTDLVLMAPGVPHSWQDHGVQPLGNHKVIVIHFLENMLPGSGTKSFHLERVNYALYNSRYGLELSEINKNQVLEIVSELDESQSFDNFQRILKLLYLFGDANQTRKLCSEGYSQPDFKKAERRLEKALLYIQENYSRKLLIQEVANQIHLSPSAFSHYFKSRTLKSFTNYVLELRLGKAAQLLQFTDTPVTRVGLESGFQNNSHFNSSFKKRYYITPLKFRKQSFNN